MVANAIEVLTIRSNYMEGNNRFNTNTTFDGGNPIGPPFRFANDRGGVHVCSDIVLSGAPWPEFVPTQSLNISAAANPCSAVTIENNCKAQRSLNHLADRSRADIQARILNIIILANRSQRHHLALPIRHIFWCMGGGSL